MSSRPFPYVGVSGVVSPEQQAWLAEYVPLLDDSNRRLALGVKAVHKTQWLDIENRFGRAWYPVGSDISQAVVANHDRGELRVAQVFMDLADAAERDIAAYEQRFVRRLIGRTGSWLSGVQFDLLPWHRTDYYSLFDEIKDTDPSIEILVQCYSDIMSELGPVESARRLDRYEGLIDHVLFDASHGQGKRLDSALLNPFIREASSRDWLGVGVAGGLNAQVIEEVLPDMVQSFPMISIDAEGQLHKTPDNALSVAATEDYLVTAARVLGS